MGDNTTEDVAGILQRERLRLLRESGVEPGRFDEGTSEEKLRATAAVLAFTRDQLRPLTQRSIPEPWPGVFEIMAITPRAELEQTEKEAIELIEALGADIAKQRANTNNGNGERDDEC